MSYQDRPLKEQCQMAAKVMMEFMYGALSVTAKAKGEKAQADLMWGLQRIHQKKFFLKDLKPLGIDINKDPPAVVCAKYHYLTNAMGGIEMEYVVESPKKAWVRYGASWPTYYSLPVTTEKAVVEGWHPYNGESLYSIGVKDGLKVGVVISKLPSAGDPVMELFFQEYDWELTPEERCQYIPQTKTPDSTHYGSAWLEMLKASGVKWPEERLIRAQRNYARYYAEDTTKGLLSLFGTAPACELIAHTWRLMAVQRAREWKQELGIAEKGSRGLALFMKALGDIQGDEMEVEELSSREYVVRQKTCRLFPRLDVPWEVFSALNAFNEASAHCLRAPLLGPTTRVNLVKSMADGDEYFEWQVREV